MGRLLETRYSTVAGRKGSIVDLSVPAGVTVRCVASHCIVLHCDVFVFLALHCPVSCYSAVWRVDLVLST